MFGNYFAGVPVPSFASTGPVSNPGYIIDSTAMRSYNFNYSCFAILVMVCSPSNVRDSMCGCFVTGDIKTMLSKVLQSLAEDGSRQPGSSAVSAK